MALFTCPECGNQVSDKAEVCPNCGCPISELLVQNQDKSKAGQHSRTKEKTKNRRILLTVVVLVAVICLAVLLFFVVRGVSSTSNKDGLYDGIEWGTRLEAIAKKYPDGNKSDDENIYLIEIDSYENIEGLYAVITFRFENDGLYNVSVLASSDSDNIEMTHNQVSEYLMSHFTELYGNPVSNDFPIVWETSKSTVSMSDFAPIGSLLLIEYQDINIKE